MRILHTSDWHLGHTLHDHGRSHEHDRFLSWLLEAIEAHAIDALLIAGDVFETANPSAAAQAAWYRFVTEARRRFPRLDVVAIGGNHDSADRLDAPQPLFVHGFDVHVVGGLPRRADRSLDLDRLLVPLRNREGQIGAWVAAVPFLRPADLPPIEEGDPLIEGVRAVYAEVFAEARRRKEPGQALVAMGHLYMTGTTLSELSERRILGGNQHALPADIFPDDLAYAALGHLHLAQKVAKDHIRYSGSPIPLSMGEIDYPHQVVVVELEGEKLRSIEALRVPRAVELIRLPRSGALDRVALMAALEKLPPSSEEGEPAFLEVRVRLDQPDPKLRSDVEALVAEKHVRLVRLSVETGGDQLPLADRMAQTLLDELLPQQVFENRYLKVHGSEPPRELVEAFHELLDLAHQRRGS